MGVGVGFTGCWGLLGWFFDVGLGGLGLGTADVGLGMVLGVGSCGVDFLGVCFG